jgi:hypothetical protein
LNGGIIPPGGVELDAVSSTVYGNLDAIMQTQLVNAQDLTTSTITLSGAACARADYKDNYTATFILDDTALYCTRGNELWELYFSYNDGDPAASAHIAAFNSILASMKLISP